MSLSGRDLSRLETCHADLRRLFKAVAEEVPIQILCGHRNKPDQDAAYASGASNLPWPKSKHNSFPARAVDVAPKILDWKDEVGFNELAKIIQRKAKELGIAVRWGANWDMDEHIRERGEWDSPHWELVETSTVVRSAA